jgi:regulator of protease activity HflC (stomatin/prohibitin superfamily)
MKNFILVLFAFVTMIVTMSGCAAVDSGHQGVEVSWGGETNMKKVHNEGLHNGFHWLFDDMVEYDCRQKTVTITNEFLDKDGLSIPIEAILYYNVSPAFVNKLHKEIGRDFEATKVIPTFKAALKNVIPKFRALELNTEHRDEADAELSKILEKELGLIYCTFVRVSVTDVDIPKQISEVIIAKQKQDEQNLLAEKKKLEQENLAQANIAKSKGDYEAAKFDAMTKDIMSQPKMLELKRLEIDQLKWEGFAKHGKSPYGDNNIFGAETAIVKGLK